MPMKRYRLSWIAFHVLVGLESLVHDKVGDMVVVGLESLVQDKVSDMVVSVISVVRRRLAIDNGVR